MAFDSVDYLRQSTVQMFHAIEASGVNQVCAGLMLFAMLPEVAYESSDW